MRELSSGVYNLLNSTRSKPMSVAQLLPKVQDSDEHLESNLSTILKTGAWYKTVLVHETK